MHHLADDVSDRAADASSDIRSGVELVQFDVTVLAHGEVAALRPSTGLRLLGNLDNQQVGLVLIIPYACALVAMVSWNRHSDRTGERTWHLVLPAVVGMVGFLVGGYADNFYLAVAAFSVGAMGIYSCLPLFWTLPTAVLGGTAAAGGIALINSIGNLSGYFGPTIMGALKDATEGYTAGLLVIAASLATAAILSYVIGRRITAHGLVGA